MIEVEFEKGCLSVETYIKEEAYELVQNELGKSKRLTDSKENILEEMKDLLCLRMQVAKSVWQRQLEEYKQRLKEKIQSNDKIESKVKQLTDQIRDYVKINRGQIAEMDGAFSENLRHLLNFMKTVIREKARLVKEKTEILNLIGEKEKSIGTKKLDTAIKEHLQTTNSDLIAILEHVKDKDEKLYQLENLLIRTHDDKKSKLVNDTATIDRINAQLEIEEEKRIKLENESIKLEEEVDEFECKLGELTKKSQLIERTRRIGYIPKVDKAKLSEISEEKHLSRSSTYSGYSSSTNSISSSNCSRRHRLKIRKSKEFGEMLFED
ncbi:DgyrCDS1996 [Dimorphilus gyrociliatus]|uniref:DgyrCDS1996 n=1 Tax=Dimorphilus gyrociliatus TaxID=2664684 RepID=A0A7I8V962_9ANNE|nr:DgyrCDS1996 [Dimorphilus gyrociliatus]